MKWYNRDSAHFVISQRDSNDHGQQNELARYFPVSDLAPDDISRQRVYPLLI